MNKTTVRNTLKCLTVAGLVAGLGALTSGCSTTSCSSCKAKAEKEGMSSCGAKDGSSCAAKKGSSCSK
jgi:hypothetical protein